MLGVSHIALPENKEIKIHTDIEETPLMPAAGPGYHTIGNQLIL